MTIHSRFAVALNDQGRFAPTRVGDFEFRPEAERHLWQGRTAATAEELAVLVNGAIKSIIEFGDPFKTIEVIGVKGEIGDGTPKIGKTEEPLPADAESVALALRAGNRELLGVIEHLAPRSGGTLQATRLPLQGLLQGEAVAA